MNKLLVFMTVAVIVSAAGLGFVARDEVDRCYTR